MRPRALKVNDSYLNDDLSNANCMNFYFSSVFTVEDHENFHDLDYITDKKLCNIFFSFHWSWEIVKKFEYL